MCLLFHQQKEKKNFSIKAKLSVAWTIHHQRWTCSIRNFTSHNLSENSFLLSLYQAAIATTRFSERSRNQRREVFWWMNIDNNILYIFNSIFIELDGFQWFWWMELVCAHLSVTGHFDFDFWSCSKYVERFIASESSRRRGCGKWRCFVVMSVNAVIGFFISFYHFTIELLSNNISSRFLTKFVYTFEYCILQCFYEYYS